MHKVQFIVKHRYIHLAHRIGFEILSPIWFACCQVITISTKWLWSTVKTKEAEQHKTTNQAQNVVVLQNKLAPELQKSLQKPICRASLEKPVQKHQHQLVQKPVTAQQSWAACYIKSLLLILSYYCERIVPPWLHLIQILTKLLLGGPQTAERNLAFTLSKKSHTHALFFPSFPLRLCNLQLVYLCQMWCL